MFSLSNNSVTIAKNLRITCIGALFECPLLVTVTPIDDVGPSEVADDVDAEFDAVGNRFGVTAGEGRLLMPYLEGGWKRRG